MIRWCFIILIAGLSARAAVAPNPPAEGAPAVSSFIQLQMQMERTQTADALRAAMDRKTDLARQQAELNRAAGLAGAFGIRNGKIGRRQAQLADALAQTEREIRELTKKEKELSKQTN